MPETKSPPRPSAANGASKHKPKPLLDRTEEFSNEVLESVESGQRAAIDAVRKFMESVDRALPLGGESPSKREEVIDSAMEMADRLVHTQYDFLRKVVHAAGKTLGRSD
jgi:hypothetical protein